jgi:hypothetical protein
MLPNKQYPVAQREPLLRIIRNRRIHRSMPDRNASRRRNHLSNMLIGLIPHLDPKGEVAGNVVEVRIGELPKPLIHPEIRFRAGTPISWPGKLTDDCLKKCGYDSELINLIEPTNREF